MVVDGCWWLMIIIDDDDDDDIHIGNTTNWYKNPTHKQNLHSSIIYNLNFCCCYGRNLTKKVLKNSFCCWWCFHFCSDKHFSSSSVHQCFLIDFLKFEIFKFKTTKNIRDILLIIIINKFFVFVLVNMYWQFDCLKKKKISMKFRNKQNSFEFFFSIINPQSSNIDSIDYSGKSNRIRNLFFFPVSKFSTFSCKNESLVFHVDLVHQHDWLTRLLMIFSIFPQFGHH